MPTRCAHEGPHGPFDVGDRAQAGELAQSVTSSLDNTWRPVSQRTHQGCNEPNRPGGATWRRRQAPRPAWLSRGTAQAPGQVARSPAHLRSRVRKASHKVSFAQGVHPG